MKITEIRKLSSTKLKARDLKTNDILKENFGSPRVNIREINSLTQEFNNLKDVEERHSELITNIENSI